jgi:hypothetical protein
LWWTRHDSQLQPPQQVTSGGAGSLVDTIHSSSDGATAISLGAAFWVADYVGATDSPTAWDASDMERCRMTMLVKHADTVSSAVCGQHSVAKLFAANEPKLQNDLAGGRWQHCLPRSRRTEERLVRAWRERRPVEARAATWC